MQKLFIFLSIGLIFVWIQNTSGTPIRSFLSESDEDFDASAKIFPDSKWSLEDDESDDASTESKSVSVEVHENDQSSEEKQKIERALELTRELGNPSRLNMERDSGNDDDEAKYSNIEDMVSNNQREFVEENSDEED